VKCRDVKFINLIISANIFVTRSSEYTHHWYMYLSRVHQSTHTIGICICHAFIRVHTPLVYVFGK